MYEKLRDEILENYEVDSKDRSLNLTAYTGHVLKKGNKKEKQELLSNINLHLYLQNRTIVTKPWQ